MRPFTTILALVAICAPLMAQDGLTPTGMVNDFADIIPADQETALEQRLREYKRQTSIEIAVVTTPTLDGRDIEGWSVDLAERWGVGDKDADNGIVVVVAPTERKCRIETGRGIEADLTDVAAGRIIREHMIPFFKKGDYAGGTIAAVNAVMEHLGQMPFEERLRQRAEEEQRRKEAAERAAQTLGTAVAFLIGGAIVIFVCFAVFRFIRGLVRAYKARREARTLANRKLATSRQELQALEDAWQAEAKRFRAEPNQPVWYVQAVTAGAASFAAGKRTAGQRQEDIARKLTPDPLAAAGTDIDTPLQVCRDAVEAARAARETLLTCRKDAPGKVERAGAIIESALAMVAGRIAAGWLLDAQRKDLEHLQGDASGLATRAADVAEDPRALCGDADALASKAEGIQQDVLRRQELKRDLDKRIPELENALAGLRKRMGAAELKRTVTTLKEGHAPSVWRDCIADLERNAERFEKAESHLARASREAAEDTQRFDAAAERVERAERQLDAASAAILSVHDKLDEANEAKKRAHQAFQGVESAVASAKSKASDSDAGSGARSKADEASRKLSQAEELLSGNGPLDWLAIAALLATVLALAQKAKQEAESDISDAEYKRRRRRDSSYSSSSYGGGSYSSGSSSGGGFGGFSGGSFGGGGASGSW